MRKSERLFKLVTLQQGRHTAMSGQALSGVHSDGDARPPYRVKRR